MKNKNCLQKRSHISFDYTLMSSTSSLVDTILFLITPRECRGTGSMVDRYIH